MKDRTGYMKIYLCDDYVFILWIAIHMFEELNLLLFDDRLVTRNGCGKKIIGGGGA